MCGNQGRGLSNFTSWLIRPTYTSNSSWARQQDFPLKGIFRSFLYNVNRPNVSVKWKRKLRERAPRTIRHLLGFQKYIFRTLQGHPFWVGCDGAERINISKWHQMTEVYSQQICLVALSGWWLVGVTVPCTLNWEKTGLLDDLIYKMPSLLFHC